MTPICKQWKKSYSQRLGIKVIGKNQSLHAFWKWSKFIKEPWVTFVTPGTTISYQLLPFADSAQNITPEGQKSIIYIKINYHTNF